jgi:hypothetical protein
MSKNKKTSKTTKIAEVVRIPHTIESEHWKITIHYIYERHGVAHTETSKLSFAHAVASVLEKLNTSILVTQVKSFTDLCTQIRRAAASEATVDVFTAEDPKNVEITLLLESI